MRRVNGEAVKRQVPREQWPPEAHEPPITHPWWTGLCLEAFRDLSTERDCSWSLGPIPWTAINAWGRERGLRGAVLVAFEAVIRAIDNAWLPVETARLNPPAKGKR